MTTGNVKKHSRFHEGQRQDGRSGWKVKLEGHVSLCLEVNVLFVHDIYFEREVNINESEN